jgi:hypothetical protein
MWSAGVLFCVDERDVAYAGRPGSVCEYPTLSVRHFKICNIVHCPEFFRN